ncbi:MAG: hypothetical protein ABIT71_07215 [Vicinamibacteraceae bacterium]
MPLVPLGSLPDDSRLWVFAAERALAPAEADAVLGTVDAFLGVWAAHGHPLRSARELRESRFLIVAVDEAAAGASGCSIDSLVREIRGLEPRLGVALVDHGPIVFRDGGTIRRVPRDEFAELARTGHITPDTVVFDNTISRLAALRGGSWELPASASWHGRAFF